MLQARPSAVGVVWEEIPAGGEGLELSVTHVAYATFVTDRVQAMLEKLPRREREVMEVLCGISKGTVADILAAMPDPPSYSAVRTILGRLQSKKFVRRRSDAHAHVYEPAEDSARIQESTLRSIVDMLFGGSAVSAATALMNLADQVDEEELEQLQRMIDRSRARR